MKNNYYNTKQADTIKDIDESKRQVAVYLSRFDVMDSDNDIIRKGAFKKSIKERGVDSTSNRKIAFLRFHDWQKPIGKFIELNEDEKGLFAVGELGNSTLGNDAWNDYNDGIIREHSIGFQYVKDKTQFIEDKTIDSGGYFDIKELILWEGSAVTFGANEYTNVIDVIKGANNPDVVKNLFDEINVLTKALSSGKGTDERLIDIEMKLKYLTSQLSLLASNNPNDNVQLLTKANENESQFDWTKVMQNVTFEPIVLDNQKAIETKQSFNDYPQQAKANAKKGIELNKAVGNKCATNIGKLRAQQIANGENLSLDVLKRTYSYLSRAETYYNSNDQKACGTISFLLWGGKAMLSYCKNKLSELGEIN